MVGSGVMEEKGFQARSKEAEMRIYHTKPAKQSSPSQHSPALPTPSTSPPTSVNSATGSEGTSNTHGTVDFHLCRC